MRKIMITLSFAAVVAFHGATYAGDDPAKQLCVQLGDGLSFDMLRIEPGTFTIGSPPGESGRKNIENQHDMAIIKPFYLGAHEVTQAVWEYVMTAKIAKPRGKTNSCGLYWGLGDTMDITCDARPSKFIDPQKPVDSVSWRQCKEFIARLNLLVDGPAFRLPTEAEWEYAARAGTNGAYFFGNDKAELGAYAWFKPNSGGETHAVGTMRPNPWGLYDMYGNVWEWCEDAFDNKPYHVSGTEAIADYCNRGNEGGTKHQVIRGGSFAFSAAFCRSASRSGFDPWQHDHDNGLRLARDVR